MRIAVRPSFTPIPGEQVTSVSRFFDANNDGKLDVSELSRAGSTLTFLGDVFQNDKIRNLGYAFNEMSDKVASKDKNVDMDGDGAISYEYKGPWLNSLGWKPPQQELATIIARNDKNQLEEADLNTPRTNFKDVDRNLAKLAFQIFDSNGDGKDSVDEMQRGADMLGKIGTLLNNDALKNLSSMFTRMIEEVNAGNTAVDANGDRAVSYNSNANFPPGAVGLVAQSELDTLADRNDRNTVQTVDMQYPNKYLPIIGPIPVKIDITDQVKKQIDSWLTANQGKLNAYGDSKDTMYAGGTPLFNEAGGTSIDKYQYIVNNHPDSPWAQ